jgi:hypothetical protein
MVAPVATKPQLPWVESILALHQLLKEQVDFTQGNNRARVRVVAYHPPEYLRRKLSFLYIPFFSRYYQLVETLSIASIHEILRSIPQSALAFLSQCLIINLNAGSPRTLLERQHQINSEDNVRGHRS